MRCSRKWRESRQEPATQRRLGPPSAWRYLDGGAILRSGAGHRPGAERLKQGFVYILTNRRDGVPYIGVTSDLGERVAQHRSGAVSSFTKKYRLDRLVWFEHFDNIHDARLVERRMKAWKREWKVRRIEEMNPEWADICHLIPHF